MIYAICHMFWSHLGSNRVRFLVLQFSLCMKPLDMTVPWYEVKYDLYAVNTQLYVSLNSGKKADVSSSLENSDVDDQYFF